MASLVSRLKCFACRAPPSRAVGERAATLQRRVAKAAEKQGPSKWRLVGLSHLATS